MKYKQTVSIYNVHCAVLEDIGVQFALDERNLVGHKTQDLRAITWMYEDIYNSHRVLRIQNCPSHIKPSKNWVKIKSVFCYC